jgi:hypothetical protein
MGDDEKTLVVIIDAMHQLLFEDQTLNMKRPSNPV